LLFAHPCFQQCLISSATPAAGGFRDLFAGFPDQRSLTIGDTCKIQHFFHHFFSFFNAASTASGRWLS
jgi:hypothetical protein